MMWVFKGKKVFVFLVFVFTYFVFGSCIRLPFSEEVSGVFNSDFLIDDFNIFDDSQWVRLTGYFLFSELRPDNVSILNDNLVFIIPNNSTSSGGIESRYKFPRGNFSILFLKTNDNSILDFTLRNSEDSVKFFIRVKYDYTNFVEYGVESPYTNFMRTNYTVSSSYSYHSVRFEVLSYGVNYYFDESLIDSVSFDYMPQYLYVRVFSYLGDATTYFYNRYIVIDKFSYQKR